MLCSVQGSTPSLTPQACLMAMFGQCTWSTGEKWKTVVSLLVRDTFTSYWSAMFVIFEVWHFCPFHRLPGWFENKRGHLQPSVWRHPEQPAQPFIGKDRRTNWKSGENMFLHLSGTVLADAVSLCFSAAGRLWSVCTVFVNIVGIFFFLMFLVIFVYIVEPF